MNGKDQIENTHAEDHRPPEWLATALTESRGISSLSLGFRERCREAVEVALALRRLDGDKSSIIARDGIGVPSSWDSDGSGAGVLTGKNRIESAQVEEHQTPEWLAALLVESRGVADLSVGFHERCREAVQAALTPSVVYERWKMATSGATDLCVERGDFKEDTIATTTSGQRGLTNGSRHFSSKRCGLFTFKRCGLCNRRLRGRVAFACPRCGLMVCDHSCWVFESSRCRLCEQNHVPIFSPDVRWWDRHLGPRTQHGRCQVCLNLAHEVDLRACRKCGRLQCRDCWDSSNGQCSRCQWTIEDLPETLRPYILAGADEARVSRAR